MPSSVNRKKLRIVAPNDRRRSAPISSNVQTDDAFFIERNQKRSRFHCPTSSTRKSTVAVRRSIIKSSNDKRCRRVFRKISIRAVLGAANVTRHSFFTQRRNFVQNKIFTNLARNANYTYFNVDVNIKKRSLTLRNRYFPFFPSTLTQFGKIASRRARLQSLPRPRRRFSPFYYPLRNFSQLTLFAKHFFRIVFAKRLMLFILNNRRRLANLYCRRKAPFFLFFLIFLVFLFLKILLIFSILPQQVYFIVKTSLVSRRATPSSQRF